MCYHVRFKKILKWKQVFSNKNEIFAIHQITYSRWEWSGSKISYSEHIINYAFIIYFLKRQSPNQNYSKIKLICTTIIICFIRQTIFFLIKNFHSNQFVALQIYYCLGYITILEKGLWFRIGNILIKLSWYIRNNRTVIKISHLQV